jgi:hypothetical protein
MSDDKIYLNDSNDNSVDEVVKIIDKTNKYKEMNEKKDGGRYQAPENYLAHRNDRYYLSVHSTQAFSDKKANYSAYQSDRDHLSAHSTQTFSDKK